jgi:GR25 family glycosyltransferase involved in LPS biosynthesis
MPVRDCQCGAAWYASFGHSVGRTVGPIVRKAPFVICALLITLVQCNVPQLHVEHTSLRFQSRSQVLAFYINLAKRADRRTSIEKQLAAANFKYLRVDAIDGKKHDEIRHCWQGADNYTCAGMIGVKLSHISAIDAALISNQRNHEFVIIFEDDFTWSSNVDPAIITTTLKRVKSLVGRWDVLLLSAVVKKMVAILPTVRLQVGDASYSQLVEINDAQAANAYAVKHEYLPKLRSVFLSCNVTRDRSTAIDQCWKPLQRVDRWVGFSPPLGIQTPSYSDIELRDVNYTSMF